MQKTSSVKNKVVRMAFDAMMIAIYVVFSTVLTFKTPLFEVSMVGVPILLAARLFGIGDALIIATLGSFIEQAMSPYGLSVTTPLWMMPLIVMAGFAGLAFLLTRKHSNTAVLLAIIIVSELLLTVLNTAALYIDGYIWQYAVKALHLIAIPRLINSGVRMVISCILVPLLVIPLERFMKRRDRA